MASAKLLPPNPARLIEGLRDTGYDFNTALADIIDNSIDAGATRVLITMRMDVAGDVAVRVADNGCGMNEDELYNAMTYGAENHEKGERLGKFGLGLKTASTAFCRRLSVVSRGSEGNGLVKATWDLDHVADVNRWELLIGPPSPEEQSELEAAAGEETGTLVTWESVDRLLKDYQSPSGAPARKALRKIEDEFRDHAAMVYQRFLDTTDERARNVQLLINGRPVPAWDPFCRDVPGSELVAQAVVPVTLGSGRKSSFEVKAYVLPRREEFASEERARDARIENKMQGIYIYRENRLIHPHDWLGMFTKEPHGSLLRVEFSFDHVMDESFHVDIKKSHILLDEGLYEYLQTQFLPAPRNAANQRYRRGQNLKAQKRARSAHTESNAAIGSRESELVQSVITVRNPETNEVEVTNRQGRVVLQLTLSPPAAAGEVNVQAVAGLDDGILWEPGLIEGHHAVRINTMHPYYHKVYVPNLSSGVTVQGMDSLLWALAEAELGTISERTKGHFRELRFEVSQLLRRLVEELPEPAEDDFDVEG